MATGCPVIVESGFARESLSASARLIYTYGGTIQGMATEISELEEIPVKKVKATDTPAREQFRNGTPQSTTPENCNRRGLNFCRMRASRRQPLASDVFNAAPRQRLSRG